MDHSSDDNLKDVGKVKGGSTQGSSNPSKGKKTAIPGSGHAERVPPSLIAEEADRDKLKKPVMLLGLGALGIVFGDIGTSPLYALHACFHSSIGVRPTEENIFGVLSMVFWALALVVAFKYLVLIMRADHRGEGGIFALLAKVRSNPSYRGNSKKALVVTVMAICGAALMYGDGVITPSISVLSAVEGLEVASSDLKSFVIPIALIILIMLFVGQRFGVERLSFIFGPIMLVWFVSIAFFGLMSIIKFPMILEAANPWHAVSFWVNFPWRAFIILGAVVLAITGGEALFADMGQFTRKSISLAWYVVVWPSLIINYFGQGAHLLGHESAAVNPFFAIVPPYLVYSMVVVATLAAIIASQALISGAFTLTRQAMQLGFLPACRIVHTSKKSENQVFIPGVNRALLLLCVCTIIGFQTANNLSAAYGVAVTALMVTTSLIFCVVLYKVWGWSLWIVVPVMTVFLIVDTAFFASNLFKVPSGGWFPLVLAAILILQMTIWRRGRILVEESENKNHILLKDFIAKVQEEKPHRMPGAGVYLMAQRSSFDIDDEEIDETGVTPPTLAALYSRLSVLHEQVVVLFVEPRPVPMVAKKSRIHVKQMSDGFWVVKGRYGFGETHNVPRLLKIARPRGLAVDLNTATYFTLRNTIVPVKGGAMSYWRASIFAMMSRNAVSRASYFELPADRIFEVGMLSEL